LRTLVVSDLHIGARHGRARLDGDAAAVEALAAAASQADRLVLLGDILELRQQPMRDALAAASRVLPRVVARLGEGGEGGEGGQGGEGRQGGEGGQGREGRQGGEVVLVAGNHDHELFGAWASRRASSWNPPTPPAPLTLETPVDWRNDEPLAALAGILSGSGASVRAAYPGVWLRDDVYATHGHYLDRHTTAPGFERLGAGVMSKLLKLPEEQLRSPDDYERILAPIYAWMLALSERGGHEIDGADGGGSIRILRILREGGLKGRSLQAGVSALAKVGELAGLGELSGDLSAPALTLTELRGLGTALANLGVDANHVLFGHTHRAGPLDADDAALWLAPGGATLFNSGCWVQEGAAFMTPEQEAVSPYRAGFAIELDDHGPPRLVNLLDS
jgi:predicted phosphodiesterase